MVKAGDYLFVAGPLGEAHKSLPAFQGKEGMSLQVFAKDDGRLMAKYPLDSLPVFEGMAAAGKRLFLVTADGVVQCFGGSE